MSRSAVHSPAQDPVGALHHELRLRLADGQRFAALLGRGDPTKGSVLTALVAHDGGVSPLSAALPAGVTHYPALTPRLPAAFWYKRAIHDLVGLVPDGHPRRGHPASADPAALQAPRRAEALRRDDLRGRGAAGRAGRGHRLGGACVGLRARRGNPRQR